MNSKLITAPSQFYAQGVTIDLEYGRSQTTLGCRDGSVVSLFISLLQINFYNLIVVAGWPPYQNYVLVWKETSKQCKIYDLHFFNCEAAPDLRVFLNVYKQLMSNLSFVPLSPCPFLFPRISLFLQSHLFFPYHLNLPIISLPQLVPSTSALLFCPSLSSLPPAFHQHFIIQQGFTGTLWNHLFHGSLIECDTSHTSNGRSSDSFSLCLSVCLSESPCQPPLSVLSSLYLVFALLPSQDDA